MKQTFTLEQIVTKLQKKQLTFPLKVRWYPLHIYEDLSFERIFTAFRSDISGNIIGLHCDNHSWHSFGSDKYKVEVKSKVNYLPAWF